MLVSKGNKKIILLFFLAISFVLFANGLTGDFVFDDDFVITSNPFIRDPSLSSLKLFFVSYHYKQPETGLYRPLTAISYLFNQVLFGESTLSFHAFNIILHGLVAFYLFLLLEVLFEARQVILKKRERVYLSTWSNLLGLTNQFPFLTALIFLFIPIHVEAVTSIVGRAELLAALFTIIALYYYVRRKMIFSSVAFFLALLSKEHVVVFVGLWFFVAVFFYKEKISRLSKPALCYGISLLTYFSLRFFALKEYIFTNDASFIFNPIKHAEFLSGLFTSLKVSYFYVQKTIFPTVFSSDYSYNQIKLVDNFLNSFETIAGFGILAFLVFLAFWKWNSIWGLAAIFFLAPYFIISNMVLKIGTIMAERLAYFPSVGMAMLLALGFSYIISRERIKYIGWCLLVVLLVFYSINILDRNKDWLNEVALYESAYLAAPDSVINMTNKAYLIATYDKDLNAAREIIEKILESTPDHIAALNLGASIYNQLGNQNKAKEMWERTIELKPTYIRGWRHLGELYYQMNQLEKADEILTKAIDLYPRWNEAFLLSLTKTKLQEPEAAIAVIEKHFGDNPENLNLKFALGYAYYKMGDGPKAKYYFDQSRNADISEEDFLKALKSI